MNHLRIAILDEELPYPLTSGKRIRTYNLLARLAESHRITILCHRNADAVEAERAEEVFHRLGIETIVVDRAVPEKSGSKFYARLAGNLLSQLPYSVATHTSPQLIEAVRKFASQQPVDVWHCEWTPYAQVLRQALGKQLKKCPWIVMAHNVESLIWKRYTETEEHAMKRWYIRHQWKKFEKFERWAFANATWSVAVSDEDASLIQNEFSGSEQIEVVDNGVDTQFFQPMRDVERQPRQLLFLGSLDWRPNQDGVKLLLERIFPEVRAKIPDAKLQIVGRNPPDWMQEAAKSPGVQVHGNVPDVRPYLANCSVMVVPLRVGGGSRLKILEALATATPVVSTQVGAEGLRIHDSEHLSVVTDDNQFAAKVIENLREPDRFLDYAEEGRRLVVREYDWASLAEKLEEVWQVAAEKKKMASVPDNDV